MSAPHSVQDAIKNFLLGHPWIALGPAIPVFTQDDGDLVNKISITLGPAGVGICVLITIPAGHNLDPRSHRVELVEQVEIRVIECPIINRAAGGTQKTAYQTIRAIMAPWKGSRQPSVVDPAQLGLAGWCPGVAGCSHLRLIHFAAETDPSGQSLMLGALFEFNETLS